MRILIFTSFLFTFPSHADDQFCSSIQGLDQIAAYFKCQSVPDIAACAGLATVIGGRILQEGISSRLKSIEQNRKVLEKNLAKAFWWDRFRDPDHSVADPLDAEDVELGFNKRFEELKSTFKREKGLDIEKTTFDKLYQQFKNDDELIIRLKLQEMKNFINVRNKLNQGKQVFYPVFETKDLVDKKEVVDLANTEFEDLPPQAKKAFEQQAKVAVDKLSERVREGGGFDQAFLEDAAADFDKSLSRLKKASAASLAGEKNLPATKASNLPQKADPIETWAKNMGKIFSEVMSDDDFRNIAIANNINKMQIAAPMYESAPRTSSASLETVLKYTQKLGAKSPLIAAGSITAKLLGDVLLAVSELPGFNYGMGCAEANDEYIYRDHENDCKPDYSFGLPVLLTLKKSSSEQLRALQTPAICDYYRKFHNQIFRQPKFVGLECKPDKFILKTKFSDGNLLRQEGHYFSNSKKIRQINFSGADAGPPLQLNEDGTVRHPESGYVAARMIPLKLYIMDAYNCCNAQNDAESMRCQAAYNALDNRNTTESRPSGVNK